MSKTRASDQWRGWLYVAPALVFVAVFVVIPFGQLIVMSMTDRSLLGGGKFIGLSNYVRIWNDSGFWRALLFTVKYTIVLTPILMILGFALALLTADNTPLKRLAVPTLILWGAQDRWVPPADAFRFQNDIKGAKLEIFEKLGHSPMEEDPKATAAAVASFLMPIPARPTPPPTPVDPAPGEVHPSVVPEKD